MGTDFAFCFALNAGGQKKTVPTIFPLQECPFNAHKVPLNGSQFSKKQQLRRFFSLF